ncbi:hypothetical protein D3OALGA1CA_2118 [Olavius algarvensis associated proteobacterium Delta 3]|nr:hypothetical protein D3OALGB2SA_667 [Olavius algarvensis associated proteobacterium Delta 3]CAB5112631.1 hypothetical protein D3OALGA1CA_2118 [Olavius algarvensis associated proteobacterium Delta 3]
MSVQRIIVSDRVAFHNIVTQFYYGYSKLSYGIKPDSVP